MHWWEKSFPKLDGAIRVLISSNASLPGRLEAAIEQLSSLSENDVPLTIRNEFTQMMNNILAYRNSENPVDLQPSLALAIFAFYKKFMVEAWPPTIPLDRL